ncbi:VgrG protein [Gilliamella apicola]|nr:VgrG protein [Gilliamella apicola]
MQAQNANLNMAAKQDIKIDSVDGELIITASEKITLICGGSYIKISEEGIELGTQDNVYLKCNVMQKMGTAQKNIQNELPSICKGVQQDSAEKHAIIVERK